MIDFPCKCGFAFSLPQDQAGGLIQCPACGLLADVPTLSDIENLNSDGTFAFEDPLPVADNITAADLHRVFTNKTTDSRGVEKDLRPTLDFLDNIGEPGDAKARPAPRYDPVTGDLIRPLQLKDETPVPVISMGVLVDPSEAIDEPEEEPLPVIAIPIARPTPRPRSLGYAMGETRQQVTLQNLGVELLMPANSAVMFFIFLMYIIGYYITSGIATYTERFVITVWPFLIVNVCMWLVLSHVGCVIEDTGPEAIDELPRPLRNFSPGEDFISPLFRVLLAIGLCFWPLVLGIKCLNWDNHLTPTILFMLAAICSYFFPATLLTAITGTTILNLRFDRVLAVIRLCGLQYVFSMLLFLLGAIPSIYYIAGELLFRLVFTGKFFQQIDSPPLMVPLMLLAIYFLHFFCWHLGLMYRAHHEEFPWLAQRHVKQNFASKRRVLNG